MSNFPKGVFLIRYLMFSKNKGMKRHDLKTRLPRHLITLAPNDDTCIQDFQNDSESVA